MCWTGFKFWVFTTSSSKKGLHHPRPDLQPRCLWCKSPGLVLLYNAPGNVMLIAQDIWGEKKRKKRKKMRSQHESLEWTWATFMQWAGTNLQIKSIQIFFNSTKTKCSHDITWYSLDMVDFFPHTMRQQSFLLGPVGSQEWQLSFSSESPQLSCFDSFSMRLFTGGGV